MTYFPPPHPVWERPDPQAAGLEPAATAAAARPATEH